MTATAEPEIGKARVRKEDHHLITGRTRWTDNIVLPGMQHVAILRSLAAHARITSIDTTAARSMPGVVAVYTGADLAAEQGSLPNAWQITEDMKAPPAPSLAVDTVNFAGEAVAVVVARTAYEAQDALEGIDVEYDDLPVVLDLAAAAADGAELVHRDLGTNVSAVWTFDSAEAGTGADVEDAIRDAEVLLQRTFRQQRLIPAFMEPRSVVVDPTAPQLTMWSATQVPHILRLMLAMTLEIPEHKVRVIAPDVGGGFGGKLQVTPEEVIALLVARRLGKPVKYTESRSESMLAAHHGRDQIQKLTLAARRDGTVTGLKVELLADMGAYLRLVTSGIPILGAFMFNGIYKFPSYHFTCTNVFTNKVPTDAYRGAGRPEATFAIERMMDELAAELSRDPLELRSQNWITHEEFPFDTVAGLTYDSGNYEAATAQARELFDYDGLRREQAERRERQDPVQLGIGVSTFTEMCGLAPSRVLGSLSYGAGGWEHAAIRMLPTGKVEVVTGSSPHGQGHETAPDRRRPTRSPVRGHRNPPWRHAKLAARAGHLRIAVTGGRSDGGGQGGGEGDRQGQAFRSAHDGMCRGRPGIHRRRVPRGGDREGRHAPRNRSRRVRRTRPARRRGTESGFRGHLRSGEFLVPTRNAFVRNGSGYRDRAGADSVLCLRRRHRPRGEPADRRWTGARRTRAGHRAGLV
jgi:carbon-monoxide dehydrogenase large subunit